MNSDDDDDDDGFRQVQLLIIDLRILLRTIRQCCIYSDIKEVKLLQVDKRRKYSGNLS